MDFGTQSGSSSTGDKDADSSSRQTYHRHTPQQIQILENVFKDCPHPDDNQRRQLSVELGLEPKQIKFWFQNKRTQTKAQNERQDNSVLRCENERIHGENIAIREALKNVMCPACGGPPFQDEERQRCLQILRLENAQLKQKYEKVSNFVAKFFGRSIEQMDEWKSPGGEMCNRDDDYVEQMPELDGIVSMPFQLKEVISDMEKELMSESGVCAMDELVTLLQVDEPLWVPTPDGKSILHRLSYDKMFPKATHFRSSSARFESTKDSGIVSMSASSLVAKFLDPDEWMELFPTIVSKSHVLQVIESEMLARSGASLKLMYQQMHILSPLVPPRDFYFLRYCRQTDKGVWVVVDVSYDCLREIMPPSRSWRLPSGCMIRDLPGGCSEITWIEHVEVDDKSQTHRLYRDLVCACIAYGAGRWIASLQRSCERLAFTNAHNKPLTRDIGGVIHTPQARRNLMHFGLRMMRDFCSTLSMIGKLDFPTLSEVNNCGIRISVRRGMGPTQPGGTIVTAANSLWFPFTPQRVFDFFKDVKARREWDVLTNGSPPYEITNIVNGANPENCTSIIRPFAPSGTNMLILQECCTDPCGGMIIYAPVHLSAMSLAINGEVPSTIPILPSGFIISSDGRVKPGGSLLAVVFQILVSSATSSLEGVSIEAVASVNTLISSTVEKIKASLNCSDLD